MQTSSNLKSSASGNNVLGIKPETPLSLGPGRCWTETPGPPDHGPFFRSFSEHILLDVGSCIYQNLPGAFIIIESVCNVLAQLAPRCYQALRMTDYEGCVRPRFLEFLNPLQTLCSHYSSVRLVRVKHTPWMDDKAFAEVCLTDPSALYCSDL